MTNASGTPQVRPAALSDHDAIRALYETCFPTSEQTPWSEQEQYLLDGTDVALVAAATNGAVTGFAILTDLDDEIALLGYLAVDPTVRSAGTGAALLSAARDTSSAWGRTWLLIEVEPAGSPTHPHRGDPDRRIAFYRRHGAHLAALGYAMPSSTNDTSLVDLDLYALRTDDATAEPSPHEVEAWVRTLWGPKCYDIDSEDPRLREMLRRLDFGDGKA
jgi:GNAT superfamily N-acetyltransferase